jgi:flagellar hook-associated protein 3 FlgL
MSAVMGAGEFGAFGGDITGALVGDAASVKQQLNTLLQQASDGYVSDTYAGLGSGIATALSLSPQLTNLQTWQNTIAAATTNMSVAQNALSQISSIASNFYAQTANLNGLDPSEVDSVAASARSALQQVAELLDTTDGNDYVFSGQDSSNPAVPDPDSITSSGFFTQIEAAVQGLGTSGAAATISATLAIASSNAAGTSPFSAALSQPASALAAFRTSVAVGQGQSVPTSILASTNADITSTGSSTTGSYMRDILRALATIGSMSSSQISDTGFDALVQDTHTSLGDAITALNADAGVMGDRQSALQTEQSTLADQATALQSQLSGAQDVDMAQTLSQLSQTQTRLQASYQIISGLTSISLVKYLSPTTV